MDTGNIVHLARPASRILSMPRKFGIHCIARWLSSACTTIPWDTLELAVWSNLLLGRFWYLSMKAWSTNFFSRSLFFSLEVFLQPLHESPLSELYIVKCPIVHPFSYTKHAFLGCSISCTLHLQNSDSCDDIYVNWFYTLCLQLWQDKQCLGFVIQQRGLLQTRREGARN